MTDTTIHTGAQPGFSFRNFFAGIGRGIMSYAESRSRFDEVRRFQAMSDEELARRGLTRDTIAQHVFRDILWV